MKKYYAGVCLLFCFLLFFGSITEGKNGSIIFSSVEEGVDGGWLSGWQYRKSHEIQGSTAGAVTDYQVMVVVHYGDGADSGQDVYLNGKCRTDFGDIRFTDSDGVTLLDYWMESYVSGDYAVFWVEVPNIPADPDNTVIYIYYGKSDATTTSNGKNTFPIFYNFNTDESSEWVLDAGQWQWDTSNGWLKTGGVTGQTRARVKDTTVSTGQAIRIRIKWAPDNPFVGTCFAYQDSANFYHHRLSTYSGAQHSMYRFQLGNNGYLFSKSYSTSTDTWYILETRWISSTKVLCYINDELAKTVTSGLVSSWTSGGIGVRSYHYSTTDYGYYDWFLVRKCVDPEPSHGSWGNEELPNQPPNPPSLNSPQANERFDPSISVTFTWTFNDPDAGDAQSAYRFQLDDNSDFSSPIIDTGKVASSESSTTQSLLGSVGLYYWRVKTWDSQNAEGDWSEARPIIVDRIKIIAGGVVDFTVDIDVGGKIWYYAVYEYDNSTFDDSCGLLYLNGFEMIWDGEKWVYAFPYSTEGNQIIFHITGVLDNQYGLTEINNQAGDIIINWATATIEIKK